MHDTAGKNSRRRSLSASRTLDSTVNFVGRIGASLRISSRKRAKEKQKLQLAESCGGGQGESWLRSGVHYAKVGVERRRSACSAIFMGAKTAPKLYFADEECAEEELSDREDLRTPRTSKTPKSTAGLETHHQKRYQIRSNSVVTSRDRRLAIFSQRSAAVAEMTRRGSAGANAHRRVRPSRSSIDFGAPGADISDGEEDASASPPPRYIDDEDEDDDDEDDHEAAYYTRSNYDDEGDKDDPELLSLALVPLPYAGASPLRAAAMTRSAVSSPLTVISGRSAPPCGGGGGPAAAHMTRSCPPTPQMTPARRRYLREGATQLTSLATLCTHHRYLFLFNDLLLISKQNTEAEKNEWFAKLSDCIKRSQLSRPLSTTISVAVRIQGRQQLIRCEVKNGVRASQLIQELIEVLDLPTLDPHLFHYELCFESGSHNNNNNKDNNSHNNISGPGEAGSTAGGSAGTLQFGAGANFQPPTAAAASFVGSGASFLTGGPNAQITALNGVESVYAILMDYVFKSGLSLSDSQLAHLDTCPLVNVRLVLRKKAANGAAGVSTMGPRAAGPLGNHSRSSTALNLMNHFRKVLNRADSSHKTRIFGRQLEGSMPPQPVLTMIDHLTMHGVQVEGIFRRCPKKSTTQEVRNLMDQGHVPDFHQYNIHVTAGLLKEYLRDIPGNLLISANYHLWMEVVGSADAAKRLRMCKNLLRLLPPSHTVLLRSLLRLLRRIAVAVESSKMGVNALAVCMAPSLLVNPTLRQAGKDVDQDSVAAARRENALAAYLIHNANDLFDEYIDDTLIVPSAAASGLSTGASPADGSTTGSDEGGAGGAMRFGLHHSTDSGLSDDLTSAAGIAGRPGTSHHRTLLGDSSAGSASVVLRSTSVSPDSALFEIPTSEASTSSAPVNNAYSGHSSRWDAHIAGPGPIGSIEIEEIESCGASHRPANGNNPTILSDDQEPSDESDDQTPVLSRENSDVKTQFPNRYQWRSHLSADVTNLGADLSNARQIRAPAAAAVTRKCSAHDRDAELDELYAAIGGGASPARKISNLSAGVRKISAASNISDASAATPRRSALVTKNETLGILPAANAAASNLSRDAPNAATNLSRGAPNVQVARKLKRTNSSSMRSPQRVGARAQSRDAPPERRASARAVKVWPPKENEASPPAAARVVRRQSDRDAGSAPRPQPQATSGSRPWRPPKRTAEEIVLDKSLEVNWSVSSIRSVFQQQKDDKPAAIDTVYAKFDPKPKSNSSSKRKNV